MHPLGEHDARRRRLDSRRPRPPIIDADGHIVESLPVLVETLRKLVWSAVADRLGGASKTFASRPEGAGDPVGEAGLAPVPGMPVEPWWALPTNTLDRATGFLPRLLRERLDEVGIDFSLLYSEAADLVEDGLLEPREFRLFACDNPIRLHGGMNPGFFAGTVVEEYARGVLSTAPASHSIRDR